MSVTLESPPDQKEIASYSQQLDMPGIRKDAAATPPAQINGETKTEVADPDSASSDEKVAHHVVRKQAGKERLTGFARFKKALTNWAKVIDSRESTYRAALEFFAADIPYILSSAMRNKFKFFEAIFEAGISFTMLIIAPVLTGGVAQLVGRMILPKEDHKDIINQVQFRMPELKNLDLMKQGLKRIKDEEAADQERIAKLYSELGGYEHKEKHFKEKAAAIRDFCDNFVPTEENRKSIHKLKKAIIMIESLIEGGVWGSFGFMLRGFRKYILGQDRFTGTKGYVNDAQSKKLGQAGEISSVQKWLGRLCLVLAPIVNFGFLNMVKDPEKVKNSPALQTIDKHIDMTHGLYPKLGLMFTFTAMSKWLSALFTAQGKDEMIERLMMFCTLLPSWWLGHRATNGIFAKNADKRLSKKYDVPEGILVEEDTKGQFFPEPARIHQVIKKTEHNPQLNKEATDQHASILGKGFLLHSLGMWAMFTAVNWITKLRVTKRMKKNS